MSTSQVSHSHAWPKDKQSAAPAGSSASLIPAESEDQSMESRAPATASATDTTTSLATTATPAKVDADNTDITSEALDTTATTAEAATATSAVDNAEQSKVAATAAKASAKATKAAAESAPVLAAAVLDQHQATLLKRLTSRYHSPQKQEQVRQKQQRDVCRDKVKRSPLFGEKRLNVLLQDLKHRLSYMVLGMGGMALSFLLLAAFIATSLRSTYIPYVVTVDTHGLVLNNGPLQPSTNDNIPPTVLLSQLCEFVRHVRMVSTDPLIQQQAVLQAYAFVQPDSEVARDLTSFYQENNPFKAAKNHTVEVEIANALSIGTNTLQVDWVEHITTENTLRKREHVAKKMRAIITYEQLPYGANDDTSRLLNPLNLYVQTFIVSEVIA